MLALPPATSGLRAASVGKTELSSRLLLKAPARSSALPFGPKRSSAGKKTRFSTPKLNRPFGKTPASSARATGTKQTASHNTMKATTATTTIELPSRPKRKWVFYLAREANRPGTNDQQQKIDAANLVTARRVSSAGAGAADDREAVALVDRDEVEEQVHRPERTPHQAVDDIGREPREGVLERYPELPGTDHDHGEKVAHGAAADGEHGSYDSEDRVRSLAGDAYRPADEEADAHRHPGNLIIRGERDERPEAGADGGCDEAGHEAYRQVFPDPDRPR